MKLQYGVVGLLALTLATAASAQMAPPSTDPAKIESGSYTVEPMHTKLLFAINHMGLSTYYGEFTGITGNLQFSAANPAASKLDVTIPISSVETTNAKLNGELKDAQWFDAAKFPTATFKSTSIALTGADSGTITGDLTLHGVTKPVTLEAKFHGAGNNMMRKKFTAGFDATGTIKRSDFGVSKYVPMIGDEVKLTIGVAFEKQG